MKNIKNIVAVTKARYQITSQKAIRIGGTVEHFAPVRWIETVYRKRWQAKETTLDSSSCNYSGGFYRNCFDLLIRTSAESALKKLKNESEINFIWTHFVEVQNYRKFKMNKNEEIIKETAKPVPQGSPKSAAREYFQSFVVTLVMAIFGMTFIVQAVTVPTGSMQNTINIGDYLLVNKFIFAPGGRPLPFLPQREIKRGDIIVFKYPGNKIHPEYDRRRKPPTVPYQVNYVKRVIGLPGETVEFRNNQVFIDGQLLPEHRITADYPPGVAGDAESEAALEIKAEEPRQENENYDVYYSERTMKVVQAGQDVSRTGYEFAVPGKPMVVPEDSYLVMGDSRDNSEDSRSWGFVSRDLIIGRAMFVYWSCDRAAGDGGVLGCLIHPRFERIGKLVR